jgi:two-component system phosphate regulon sensor histidine kinase PhoR
MAALNAASLAASSVIICAVFYFYFSNNMYAAIKEKAELFHGATYLASSKLIHEISSGEMRITVINPEGAVLYDNTAPAANLPNHGDRKEVREALERGAGEDSRFSDTLAQETWYYAVRMEDGNVLRAAKTTDNIFSLFARMIPVIVLIIIAMIVLTDVIAGKLTARIVRPMNEARLDGEYIPPYDELAPFAEKIASQRRQIRKQFLELEESAKLRREFSANVSHELKTPLTTIAGYAEMLDSGMINEADRADVAGKIHAEAERMVALVEDIMKLSHLDEGSPGAVFEPVDLAAEAREAAEKLAGRAKDLHVALDVKGAAATVSANRSMMGELFFNLIENAIKYNKPGGSVTVTVTKYADRVRAEVADTGIGIPEAAQVHVFDRFYRVDKSRSRKTGGTGLGLAIVKHIALVHHAKLSLESEEGRGTTVTVDFV